MEFDSADKEADIMQKWNKDAMGTDTRVSNSKEKRLDSALIMRVVDTGIRDETLAEQVLEQLDNQLFFIPTE